MTTATLTPPEAVRRGLSSDLSPIALIKAGRASWRPDLSGEGYVYGLSARERGVIERAAGKVSKGQVTPFEDWVIRRRRVASLAELRLVLARRRRV